MFPCIKDIWPNSEVTAQIISVWSRFNKGESKKQQQSSLHKARLICIYFQLTEVPVPVCDTWDLSSEQWTHTVTQLITISCDETLLPVVSDRLISEQMLLDSCVSTCFQHSLSETFPHSWSDRSRRVLSQTFRSVTYTYRTVTLSAPDTWPL